MDDDAVKTPKPGEVTERQIPQQGQGLPRALQVLIYNSDSADRTKPSPGTFKTYDEMSRNPTLALARIIATAPCRAAKWQVEADDDAPEGAEDLLSKLANDLWPEWLSWACQALDYGFQGWEIVWQDAGGLWTPERLKPLAADLTDIMVDEAHGNFAGLKQSEIKLGPEKCLLYSYNAKPGNLYGRSRHENCRETAWQMWKDAMGRLSSYMKRVAGAVPIVEYPDGETIDASGARRSHFDIARQLVEALSDARAIAMPGAFLNNVTIETALRNGIKPADLRAWHISFLESKDSHGEEFKTILTYLDQLMMRAWLVPERAATEAQSGGSRADSESHGDIASQVGGFVLEDMLATWNQQLVDRVLALNFGPAAKGTVRVKPIALSTEQQAFYRAFVQQLLVEPTNIDLLLKAVDMAQLLEDAGLPTKDEAADIGPGDVQPPAAGEPPAAALAMARETYGRMGLSGFNESDHPRAPDGRQWSV